MKIKDVTKELFAKWSFQRDRKVVGEELRQYKNFEELPSDIKETYLGEAKMYLKMDPKGKDGSTVDGPPTSWRGWKTGRDNPLDPTGSLGSRRR